MKPIVIIGTGLAGYNLARELRKADPTTPLRIITADDGAFYSKPMLSNAFARSKDATSLVMSPAVKMAAELDAEITTRTRVTAVDPAQHTLTTTAATIEYSRLVLAVGAEPILLPLGGDAADQVMSVNNLEDYAAFREAVDGLRRIAIIGPGLIGCEFANDLVNAGFEVAVIGPDATPMERLLPQAAGAALQAALAASGVEWHLGTVVHDVTRAGDGVELTLANGSMVAADAVLSAVGIRPHVALAKAAGLQVNRGIVVDRMFQSSAADVYAIGDCVEVEELVLPFVMPIMHAARALARTLAGQPTEVVYPAMPVVVKTPAHPVVVAPPHPDAAGDWRVEVSETGVRACYFGAGDRLLGFALTGSAVVEKQALTKDLPGTLD